MNQFLDALNKTGKTWNEAVSYLSTQSTILDYFSKCGSYRNRTQEEVNADMARIFAEDSNLALKVVFYNRMITRKVKGLVKTETVQKGQGSKDEFVKSLVWLENNYPELLYKNLYLIPAVGCWKDLFYDSPTSKFFYYISPSKVYHLVEKCLQDPYNRALLAKYLPKIRSNRNIINDRHRRLNGWAKELCKYLDWNEKDYRKFKSNPDNVAHLWQRQACSNQWDSIDFNTIPGKALMKLMAFGRDKKNTIERHNLELSFMDWISKQKIAKFTGYPYELYQKAKNSKRSLMQKYTFDRQFEGLIELAKQNVNPEVLKRGVLCALDTSGSMSSEYDFNPLSNLAPIDICIGLGIYFSSLLQGYFKDHVIMFDEQSRIVKLKGSFCDKVDQISREATAWGNTNFQSVIDEIVRVRRYNPNIPVEDYPQILLVVSDMQFDCVGSVETNYEVVVRKLASVGLMPITLIWWQVNGRFTSDVPSTMSDADTILLSGYDSSIVTAILGSQEIIDKTTGEKRKLNPYEQMLKVLDQEILNLLI